MAMFQQLTQPVENAARSGYAGRHYSCADTEVRPGARRAAVRATRCSNRQTTRTTLLSQSGACTCFRVFRGQWVRR